MTTKYEGRPPRMNLLFHGYRYGETSATPDWPMAPRNTALLVATNYMQRGGMLDKVVVAANWDQQGKPYAMRIREALIQEGVPDQNIITTDPQAKTTAGEVEIFLSLGLQERASLATASHMPRVDRAHRRRGVNEPHLIVAEDVLRLQIEAASEPDPRAKDLLDYFGLEQHTRRFDGKERVLRRVPERLLEVMAGNRWVEKRQESRDG
jgi:hypothetical protein